MRQWLVDYRLSKGFTQNEIAQRSGISRSYYADIERNVRNLKPDTAQAIGYALGFDWTLFFEQGGRKTSQKRIRSA